MRHLFACIHSITLLEGGLVKPSGSQLELKNHQAFFFSVFCLFVCLLCFNIQSWCPGSIPKVAYLVGLGWVSYFKAIGGGGF